MERRNDMPAERFSESDLVEVLTTQPVHHSLDYRAPAGGVELGAFVEVPLGTRMTIGVVWGEGRGGFDLSKLRRVSRSLDIPPLRRELMSFLERAAQYTLTPMPAMLRLVTRSPGLGDPLAIQKVYRLGGEPPARMTEARKRALDTLEESGDSLLTAGELSSEAGVSASVIAGLVRHGAIEEIERPKDRSYPPLDPDRRGKELTEDQSAAASALIDIVKAQEFETVLLKGVTGSGKTEVYLEAVAECLRHGRQALALLPEIALTAEFLKRIEERFGQRPAEWHSGITQTERRRCWRMAAEGRLQLVVGARSALFLPFRDLGLIVVDEEHDTSYKQEDGVLYNARDMAVLRASICGAAAALASATPSLETWANADAGKYRRLDLPSRFGSGGMPDMSCVDMRKERLPSGSWISKRLSDGVKEAVGRGEQALLFLNRRGYAPLTLCRACGHQIGCAQCDARMVEHRFRSLLMCHQCGGTSGIPEACPECGAEKTLAPLGPGVERLAEEVEGTFPDARLMILSSDMAGSPRQISERMERIACGEVDIIIGTQLAAKGHNFPLLSLVGVIDTDLGLFGGDLRAAERTFQLVRQVAGRAGRRDMRGMAMLQTHQPDHPVIQAILGGNEEDFWIAEAEARRHAGTPPYGRLAGIVLSGPDLNEVSSVARRMARDCAPLAAIGARVYGPAPAPVSRIRGRHRIRLLVKAGKSAPIQSGLVAWRSLFEIPRSVRLAIDIDPQSFF